MRTFFLEDFGAVYDDDSFITLLRNDIAILRLYKKITESEPYPGGKVVITTTFHHTLPFFLPTFPGSTNIVHFSMEGEVPGVSKLVKHKNRYAFLGADRDYKPAINFDFTKSGPYVPNSSRVLIRNLVIESSDVGIQLNWGGKDITLENVVLGNCGGDFALKMTNCHGLRLKDVYCLGNQNGGAQIKDSNLLDMVVTARENGGTGLEMINSPGNRGWLYLESNKGWGGYFNNVTSSNFHVWLEANFSENNTGQDLPQCRLRKCQIDFTGSVAQERGNGFDMDSFSRIYCKIDKADPVPITEKPFRTPKDISIELSDRLKNMPEPLRPTVSVVGTGDNKEIIIEVKKGTRNSIDGAAFEFGIQPFSDSFPGGSFEEGEFIIVRGVLKISPPGANYFRQKANNKTRARALFTYLRHDGHIPDKQEFFSYDTLPHNFELISKPFVGGEYFGLFLAIGNGTGGPDEPPNPYKMFISKLRVWRIKPGDYQNPARAENF